MSAQAGHGASVRIEACGKLRDHIAGARFFDRVLHCWPEVDSGKVSQTDSLTRAKLEPKEVLERPGKFRSPGIDRHSSELEPVDENAAFGRLV